MSGYRYRFAIDILDRDSTLSSANVKEIIADALSAANVGIPPEKKRSIKAVEVRGGIHNHDGNNMCSGCRVWSEDGLDGDNVKEAFEAVKI